MCPKAETCCLTEGDFATSSWSASSGTYLRAMRDYYWCQRSAVLYHTLYDPAPVTPVTDEFGPLTSWGHVSQSCYAHACNDFSDVMVAELDKALATHRLKSQGALVSCSNPELL